MAPRFVEIPTPVEDGLNIGSVWSAYLAECLKGAVDILPKIKCPDALGELVTVVPVPRGFAKDLIFAAIATAMLRVAYVMWDTKRIMKTHGCFKDTKQL